MSRYKVSFLIPVYNGEPYITDCFNHILQSELDRSEYQIIAWDDGSTDNSWKILQKFASEYDNIIVRHADNQGVAKVRNSLFQMAEGYYIWECDIDDYVETSKIAILVDMAMENQLDVLIFDYYSINSNNEKKRCSIKYIDPIYTSFLWNRLYSTDFIKKNRIGFNSDLYTGDDYIFNSLVFFYSKKKKYASIAGYNYRYAPNSLTRNPLGLKKDIFSMMHCIDYLMSNYLKMESRKFFWIKNIVKNAMVVLVMSKKLDNDTNWEIHREVSNKLEYFYSVSNNCLVKLILFCLPFFLLLNRICDSVAWRFNKLYILFKS